MNQKIKCNCFICRNQNNLDRLYGYFYAKKKIYEEILTQFDQNNIKSGSIGSNDNSLETYRACVECTLDEVNEYLASIKKDLQKMKGENL